MKYQWGKLDVVDSFRDLGDQVSCGGDSSESEGQTRKTSQTTNAHPITNTIEAVIRE